MSPWIAAIWKESERREFANLTALAKWLETMKRLSKTGYPLRMGYWEEI